MSKKVLFTSILVAGIAAATFFAYHTSSGVEPASSSSSSSSSSVIQPKYHYDIVYYYEEDRTPFYDAYITATDTTTGAATVIIGSIKTALPFLQEGLPNYSLVILAQPNRQRNGTIFQTTWLDTDGGGGRLFILDGQSTTLHELSISAEYDAFPTKYSAKSPTQQYIAFTIYDGDREQGISTKLYVADLVNDTLELVATLREGETLNAGGFYANARYSIKWADNDTIRYAVYDQSKKRLNGLSVEYAPLIEYREVAL